MIRAEYIKKLCALGLLLATVALSFLSCKTDYGENATGESTEESTKYAETIDPNADIFDLIRNGNAVASLATSPDNEKKFALEAKEKVIELVSEKSGITLEETSSPLEYEIVIGTYGNDILTTLKEKNYRIRDFFFGVIGKKLVLYAESEEAMQNALAEFEALLSKKANRATENISFYSTENKEIVMKNIHISGTPISEYSIVFKKSYTYSEELFAYKLRSVLTKATGTMINVYEDGSKEAMSASKVISVGSTSYAKADTCDGLSYRMKNSDGLITLSSSSPDGYLALLEGFIRNIPNLTVSGTDITESPQMTAHLEIKTDIDHDVRIFIQNIYGHAPETRPLAERVRLMCEIIDSYSPDILGFQECTPLARNTYRFADYLKTYGYNEVKVKATNSSGVNYTPLFYNPSTLEVLDKGYDYYTGDKNDSGSKSITWAIFKHKETGKIFAACSTHMFWQSDAGEDRIRNAKQLEERCKAIYAKYVCPVIAGGDFNTKMVTTPIDNLKRAGLMHLYDISAFKNATASHHTYPEFSKDYGYYSTIFEPSKDPQGSIDHMMAYKADSLEFKNYYIDKEELALMTSDHCPIISDFIFKTK